MLKALENMLRTQNLAELDFDLEDMWPTVLASVAFAIRSTHHSTLGASPGQLINIWQGYGTTTAVCS